MTKLITTLLCFVMLLCNAAYGFSQNFDVRTESSITAEELDLRFAQKTDSKLIGTGKFFIEAQAKYGINAEFLAAIAMHESACGTSTAARRKNNFFGLMKRKGGQISFNSPQECIDYAANNLTKPSGYYYARGRYTISSIGKRYASNKKWAAHIVTMMKSIKPS